MSIFTAEPATVPPATDISPRVPAAAVFEAAKHLVEFRDGLAGALLDLAEVTADLDCDTAAKRLARLCAVLGADEAYRRGVRITTIAGGVWGIFAEIGEARAATLHTLRAVCADTATAVRDELHRDACLCLGDDLRNRICCDATKGTTT